MPTLPLWLGSDRRHPGHYRAGQAVLPDQRHPRRPGLDHLAREVRGRFLALREEDFVDLRRLDGSSQWRVMFRHMLPSTTSHLIAALTLSIPGVILAETALSWLGVGLQAPVVSWGVLLIDAQSIRVISHAPWLLAPGLAVVIVVLALNFVGDGLRDAADPYKQLIGSEWRRQCQTGDALLEIRGLKTHFFTREGVVRAVDGVDLTVPRGKTVCIVGESGCGKSMTARSILAPGGAPGEGRRGPDPLGSQPVRELVHTDGSAEDTEADADASSRRTAADPPTGGRGEKDAEPAGRIRPGRPRRARPPR